MYRISHNIFQELDRIVAWIFLSSVLGLLACYLTLLILSVSAIITRNAAERDLVTLSATLAELESKHVVLNARVTLSFAYEQGFVETVPARYVERATSRQAFTFDTRGQ